MTTIRGGEAHFLLNTRNLHSEGLADIFAASVVFRTMNDLATESNEPRNSRDRIDFVGALLSELLLSLNIITVFERCRRVARQASMGFPPRAQAVDTVLHPTAVDVRTKLMLVYLRQAVAVYLFGEQPTERQFDAVDALVDGALRSIRPNLKRFEAGMNAAVTFVADRERRTTFIEQLDKLAEHLRSDKQHLDRITIEQFVARAQSLGRRTSLFDALIARTHDPRTPAMPEVAGARGVGCAWVVGPDRYNSPFTLETRYGLLIFAFAPGSQVYERFAEVSKGDLAPGFELKNTLIVADTDAALRDALAKHLPVGAKFTVVLEGTAEFETYIRELAAGTIWPD